MIPQKAGKLNNLQKPLLYLVQGGRRPGPEGRLIYCNSGPFYIMVVVILFACLGLLLNIGLKVQSINYQKEIYRLNGMIDVEEDRSDRLKLEISWLRSPSRILSAAEEKLQMKTEQPMEVVGLSGHDIVNNEKIFDYISRDSVPALPGNYDNMLGTLYYFQDIVLVVSESVLTFFIP